MRVHWLLVAVVAGLLAAIPNHTVRSFPLPNLVAWWSFEEADFSFTADHLGVHTGNFVSDPVTEAGRIGNCKDYDGFNDSVTVFDSDDFAFGSEDFTILLWVRYDAPPGGSVALPGSVFVGNDEGSGNVRKWFFAIGGDVLYFHINGPGIGPQFFPQVSITPVVDTWYHYGVRRAGTTYTIFVDGAAAGSATNTSEVPNPVAPLSIAQAEGIGFHDGNIDELMIFRRALSDSEVQQVYQMTEIAQSAVVVIE